LAEALHGRPRLALRDRVALAIEHPRGVGTGDAQVDADQAPVVHVISFMRVGSTGSPAEATHASGHGPKETRPTAAPTHVLQPVPTSTSRTTSLIRGIRGRAGCGNQTNEANPSRSPLRASLDATPRTSRDDHATLGPRCDQAPVSLT